MEKVALWRERFFPRNLMIDSKQEEEELFCRKIANIDYLRLQYAWQQFSFFAKNEKFGLFCFFTKNRGTKKWKTNFPLNSPFWDIFSSNNVVWGYFDLNLLLYFQRMPQLYFLVLHLRCEPYTRDFQTVCTVQRLRYKPYIYRINEQVLIPIGKR